MGGFDLASGPHRASRAPISGSCAGRRSRLTWTTMSTRGMAEAIYRFDRAEADRSGCCRYQDPHVDFGHAPATLTASETVPIRTRLAAQAASRLNQLRDTKFSPR